MKKITTIMVMLMGCVFSALAQTVASTPTAASDIVSGYYMLMVKSDDDKTDANGNYAYNTHDAYVSYDAKGSTTDFLGKTLTSTDEFAYVFYVEKQSDGKISLRAWKDKEHWWKDCGTATYSTAFGRPGQTPWNQTKFPLSSSKAKFDMSNGDSYGSYLYVDGSIWNGGITGSAKKTSYSVVCNDANQMGYAQSASAKNKAQFRFYAVSNVPDPDKVVSFTYNYTDGEHSKSVAKNLLLIGYDFPEANDIDFLVGAKPEGKISAEDNGKTFTILCHEELPFQTSTDAAPVYYYLENVQGDGTRLYSSNGLAYRASAQSATVNGVRDDLWYVTGNTWDGFEFHNVGENNTLKSSAIMSHSYLCALSFSHTDFGTINKCATNWEVYKVLSGNNQVFGVLPHNSTTGAGSKEYSWKWDGTDINFNAPDGEDEACAFRLVPATFTFPMYSGGDGNIYNTFAAPFAVALADDENAVKMYKGAVNTAEKELVLSGVDAVPANTGVMLMGVNSQNQNVTFQVIADAEAPAALDGNDLMGTTVELAAADLADKLILGISDETQEVGFFSINDNVATLTANHAYLNKTNSTVQTLSVRLAGQATGIGQISMDTNNANTQTPVYDLAGRRVNHTVKGQLYIQNGRKFIAQ